MADIIVSIGALQCQAPIVNNSSWTGVRYVFDVQWESMGNQYASLDPTTRMEVSIDIKDLGTNLTVYTGVIDTSAPFNTTGYQFDVLNYYSGFSNNYSLTIKLNLVSNTLCNVTTSYNFPIDYT